MAFIPQIMPTMGAASVADAELFKRFEATETKIAIQKKGELTDISRLILQKALGIQLPLEVQQARRLLAVSEDGKYGFAFTRSKSICDLVGAGAVDLAVVGTDNIVEAYAEDSVEIVESYKADYSWPIVMATRADGDIKTIDQVSRIATQYPVTSAQYFDEQGLKGVEIVATKGGTELYPYLNLNGQIDAVVDMSITGRSLVDNNLLRWVPPVAEAFPVLIRARSL